MFMFDTCIVANMDVTELQALATSIGEHCVTAVGRETLTGLVVYLDTSDMDTSVTVSLKDDTDAEHKRVIEAFFTVEELFYDETVLTLHFVESVAALSAMRTTSPAFSLV